MVGGRRIHKKTEKVRLIHKHSHIQLMIQSR